MSRHPSSKLVFDELYGLLSMHILFSQNNRKKSHLNMRVEYKFYRVSMFNETSKYIQ